VLTPRLAHFSWAQHTSSATLHTSLGGAANTSAGTFNALTHSRTHHYVCWNWPSVRLRSTCCRRQIDPKPAVPKGSAPRKNRSQQSGQRRETRDQPSGAPIKTKKIFVGGLTPDTTQDTLSVSRLRALCSPLKRALCSLLKGRYVHL
jgi:hypothetical protein